MAKIAVAVERALNQRALTGSAGGTSSRVLAQDDGWTVSDVVCTSGPGDREFEEQHSCVTIAIVAAGTFQYRGATRTSSRRELMVPGSVLLGSPGQCFECGHKHGPGDRCISFQYAPEYFDRLVADLACKTAARFEIFRLPPLRELSPHVAKACTALVQHDDQFSASPIRWEELAIDLAATVLNLANESTPSLPQYLPSIEGRVSRIVREIERRPDSKLTIAKMAWAARLSPYHFLRTFEYITGVTPHQYILRTRLREAATRLTAPAKVLDIALDCGFGDVSNFNHAFRSEFGASPREYRRQMALQAQ